MKIYISGKIGDLSPTEYRPKFAAARERVSQQGHDPVCPVHDVPHEGAQDTTWLGFMRRDCKALLDCDAILMLPCWVHSKGANIERELARSLGLKVFYAKSPTSVGILL